MSEAHHNHHHGDEPTSITNAQAQSSWDGFVELAGEWEGRQVVDGEIERRAAARGPMSRRACASMRPRAGRAAAAVAVPVWQDIRASHPDNRYRLMLSFGRAF